jgi:hypothetical protein
LNSLIAARAERAVLDGEGPPGVALVAGDQRVGVVVQAGELRVV